MSYRDDRKDYGREERKYSPSRGTSSSRYKDSDRRYPDRYGGSSHDSYSSRYADRYHDSDSRSDRKYPSSSSSFSSNSSGTSSYSGGGSTYKDGELGSRLPTQNWQETIKFEKNFYKEHASIAEMSDFEVVKFRKAKDITTSGTEVPKPIRSFEESSFPGKYHFASNLILFFFLIFAIFFYSQRLRHPRNLSCRI